MHGLSWLTHKEGGKREKKLKTKRTPTSTAGTQTERQFVHHFVPSIYDDRHKQNVLPAGGISQRNLRVSKAPPS